MNPTLTIVLLWLAFGTSHVALSSLTLRPRLVGVLGEKGFMGAYSLIALATFVPMISTYFGNKHEGAEIWFVDMTPPLVALVTVVMGVAMVILVAGLVTPNPASMSTPADKPVEPRGVHFITRHAMFMAFGLFGLVHLIANGYASDIAFFAGFPIFAVIGCLHQDQRKLVTDSERYREFHAATPLIPFTGSNTLRGLRELTPIGYVLGIGLTVALSHFHSQWFG